MLMFIEQERQGILNGKISGGFPLECVRHLARRSCKCQYSEPTVRCNVHWPSCMVGKAQEFLGMGVAWKANGKSVGSPFDNTKAEVV